MAAVWQRRIPWARTRALRLSDGVICSTGFARNIPKTHRLAWVLDLSQCAPPLETLWRCAVREVWNPEYTSLNLTVFFCFEVVCAKAWEASMHSIDLLICYCVSRSSLADLTSLSVQLCRSNGDVEVRRAIFRLIRPANAPCTLPEPWRCSDDVLKHLWARCNCGTTPQRLGSICSSGVLIQCDVTRNKHPGDSLRTNVWQSVASTTGMEPVPELGF